MFELALLNKELSSFGGHDLSDSISHLEGPLLDGGPRPQPQLPQRGQGGQPAGGGRAQPGEPGAADVEDAEPREGVAREEVALEVAVVQEVGEVALEAQALQVHTACNGDTISSYS